MTSVASPDDVAVGDDEAVGADDDAGAAAARDREPPPSCGISKPSGSWKPSGSRSRNCSQPSGSGHVLGALLVLVALLVRHGLVRPARCDVVRSGLVLRCGRRVRSRLGDLRGTGVMPVWMVTTDGVACSMTLMTFSSSPWAARVAAGTASARRRSERGRC